MYESTVLNLFGRVATANVVSEFFFSNDSPHTVCSDSSFKLHNVYVSLYMYVCTYALHIYIYQCLEQLKVHQ